jgi:hypothetical protein
MSRKGSLILAFLLLQVTLSMAQKVKYKDLIELLNAKQYEMAEPFLKRYLKENDDNASAYLFMGIIYQEKSLQNDLLKQTEALVLNLDSAIYFYEKAHPMITEKEIKKNNENYQMYTRRDLRTGEFGIKQSDVQLDLETRTKALKEKQAKVKPLKNQFVQSERLYLRSMDFFKAIQERFANEKELFLRSDDQLLVEFNNLTAVFDSSQVALKSYKSILQTLGKTNYNQELTLLEIKDFKKDGLSVPDFLVNDLKLWDYSGWSKKSFDIIQKEIIPLRQNLISYDIEINKLGKMLKTDSVSVKSDLTKLIDKLLVTQLKKFDPDPLPAAVFNMKVAELEYFSDLIVNKPIRDSADVALQMTCLEQEIKSARKLDSIASLLMKRDFDTEALDYNHFVTNAYGTVAVLKAMVKTTQDFAHRELTSKEKMWEHTMQSLKWVFAVKDSIPLYSEESETRPYKPLISNDHYTIGLKYADSLAVGYFYTIPPSRVADIAANFPVDAPNFKLRSLPILKALSLQETDQVYFALIFSESKVQESFPVTVARVNRTGGLAWSKNFKFEFKPSELLYSSATGELSVKLSSTTGESKIVVIDKLGKRLH